MTFSFAFLYLLIPLLSFPILKKKMTFWTNIQTKFKKSIFFFPGDCHDQRSSGADGKNGKCFQSCHSPYHLCSSSGLCPGHAERAIKTSNKKEEKCHSEVTFFFSSLPVFFSPTLIKFDAGCTVDEFCLLNPCSLCSLYGIQSWLIVCWESEWMTVPVWLRWESRLSWAS